MSKPNVIQASDRTALAKSYNVSLRTFNNWIQLNSDLQKLLAPYIAADKQVLPPSVVKKIYEILGEPE